MVLKMWLRKWAAVALILLCTACASAARLVWDANSEEDLAGYKIHYGSVSGPPYSHTVDVGNVTEWIIPGAWPRNQNYYFAATAYDRDGYESFYSNQAVYYADEIGLPAQATDVRITFEPREPEPLMAIALNLAFGTVLDYNYRTNSTLQAPASVADGDFLLAVIAIAVGDLTITPPSGWTSIARHTHTEANRGCIEVFYKRASSEGSSWTWSHSFDLSTGVVWRLTGVIASGSPEDVGEDTSETDYSISDLTNESITTATNGAALVQFAFMYGPAKWSSSVLTNRVDYDGEEQDCNLHIDADLQATAGASGNKSKSKDDYSYSMGILIALKPVTAVIEQEGFRFRNDDGSESAATWKASQDTNITLAADTAARIRMLLNATGDPDSIGAQLEYRYKPSGGAFGSWNKVN